MVEGRERSEWARTSFWCSLYANGKRDPKRRRKPFEPVDFSPFGKEGKPKADKAAAWAALAAYAQSKKAKGK
jgi:hypothetical protein